VGLFKRGGVLAAQDDVELVAQCPVFAGLVIVEDRDHALTLALWHRVKDWVLEEHWIIREVHLSDQALTELATVQREVDVRWAPCIVVVAPWVGARLDGIEAVVTFSISQATGDTLKVWVQRSWPGVDPVAVASSSSSLTYLGHEIGVRPIISGGPLAT